MTTTVRAPGILAIALTVVFLIHSHPGLAAQAFEPPPDQFDWLQLTSDEWLKGELIALYDDQVEFDSDKLGVLFLDWEDIRRFRGYQDHRITTSNRTYYSGHLEIHGDTISIQSGDASRTLARADLVAITPASEREFDNWSGDAALGFNIRQGNTDTLEYDLIAGLERLSHRSRILLDYVGNVNYTESENIANNHRLSGSLSLVSGANFFWRPLMSQYLSDPIQNIKHQLTIESGLGYRLIDTPQTDWRVATGAGMNYVRYDSVDVGEKETQTSPALTFGTEYETEITSWMDYLFLLQITLLDEDSGTYQHHLLTTLSTDLIGNFDLDISLIWDRIENPQQRSDGTFPEQDDFRLTVGVGYDF